ncbi:hypothetical protein Golob_024422 [Gossypium lobatum]|uniref:RNase H type-1 domain-containing protein n=1 Tax=Gossypium lobatum TaxID=34289 RepID=A0A7J8NL99_9ROSI|nr:hypothetical protein [Gossypium lobatum]
MGFYIQPKWCRGLGLRQLRDWNISSFLKLGYKVIYDDEALWIRVWLLEEIITHIMGIPSPYPSKGRDRLFWRHTSTGAFSIKSSHKDTSMLHDGEISWACLFRGLAFLNTDSAVQITSGRAVADGVIRDGISDWVIGYNRFLGYCSIFYVELWGILDGLKLIQRRGHSNVVIHLDSLEVAKAIYGSVLKISNSALIRRIHRILSQKSLDFKIYPQGGESMC